MDQPQSLNQKQREMFARLIEQARTREARTLESEGDVDRRVETEVVPRLAEERGALELAANVRKLRSQVKEAEQALGDLGFDCCDERISLRWRAPKDLKEALEAAKRAARAERDAALKKHDRAILGVWAAETLPEARKIVEELL